MQNFLTFKRQKTFDSSLTSKTDEILDKITEGYEKKIIKVLVNLYNNLSNEKINLSDVKDSVEILYKLNNINQYDYLNTLMHPEKTKGCKIPSSIPVPSCSFQLHNTLTLQTNNSGNLCVIFNPSFLFDANLLNQQFTYETSQEEKQCTLKGISSLFIANGNDLTGSSDATFRPMFISQGIPPVYKAYRIVSASVIAKYIGRLDQSSGVLGGAIVYDDLNVPGCFIQGESEGTFSETPYLSKYGNFDLCNDAFYNQEVNILDGIREIYFPIDNSYEEYRNLTTASTINFNQIPNDFKFNITDDNTKNKNFNFLIYALGVPASSYCIKLDIYVNFECLPDSTFLNYMPVSTTLHNITPQEKTEIIHEVQKKAITEVKELDVNSKNEPTFFQKLINKVGNFLPSILKIIGSGILGTITNGTAGAISNITGNTLPLLLGNTQEDNEEVD